MIVSLFACLAVLVQAPTPNPEEPEAELEHALALDTRSADGFAASSALTAELGAVELDAAQEKAWRAELAARAGPQLETDLGQRWFRPAEKAARGKQAASGRGL